MPRFAYSISALRSQLKPFKLIWYPTVGSTNTKAAELRRAGKLLAPAIVLTGRQTAGRGRGSNKWSSPPGVMTVTFVLPVSDQIQPHHVPLVAGLAVREACAELGATRAGLKWPNDIWADDLKLAGLLCERTDHVDLVGVGLNVCCELGDLPAEVRRASTSLSHQAGRAVSLDEVLRALSQSMNDFLLRPRFSIQTYLQQYSDLLVIKFRKIRVTDPGVNIEGTCEGIDSAGRLVVSNRDGRHALLAGRVSVLDRR
jgi:BirA family transcriptional regulator, biotin operon repressor / biotin---[acetyl-CoA-carboxylase] ligase